MRDVALVPLLGRLLNKIGLWKSSPKPLSAKDELWLFTNTAFRSSQNPNQWTAEFVACYFRYNTGDQASCIIASFVQKLGIIESDAAEKIVAERVELFLNLIQPNRTVEVMVDNGKGGNILLGPGGPSGISSNLLPFRDSSYRDGQLVLSAAKLPKGYERFGRGLHGFESITTVFAEPEGWGVISDIDDTIKITHVLNNLEILRHTLELPAQPVPGMPEFYRNVLQPTFNNPVWFYLTASPYNLYPFLSRFLDDFGFPKGTAILRDKSWQDIEEFIITSLTVGTQEYKFDRISKIHEWFPRRKMVLIGDSTQKDPEVYGDAARMWRGWVGAIYIRVVKGVDEVKEKELNSAQRFENAFRGVDRELWTTFEDVQEIMGPLTAVARAGPSGAEGFKRG
ncbi:hypothetical protein EV426DRAFT_245655 [Tirmania nivea]|nr:hypothetical protein EV426DRAFT_245655 [Tirmania nivea]